MEEKIKSWWIFCISQCRIRFKWINNKFRKMCRVPLLRENCYFMWLPLATYLRNNIRESMNKNGKFFPKYRERLEYNFCERIIEYRLKRNVRTHAVCVDGELNELKSSKMYKSVRGWECSVKSGKWRVMMRILHDTDCITIPRIR